MDILKTDQRIDPGRRRLIGTTAMTAAAAALGPLLADKTHAAGRKGPDINPASNPEPASYAKRFTGKYQHRLISGGIGYNLQQEAPQAFVQAIVEIATG